MVILGRKKNIIRNRNGKGEREEMGEGGGKRLGEGGTRKRGTGKGEQEKGRDREEHGRVEQKESKGGKRGIG